MNLHSFVWKKIYTRFWPITAMTCPSVLIFNIPRKSRTSSWRSRSHSCQMVKPLPPEPDRAVTIIRCISQLCLNRDQQEPKREGKRCLDFMFVFVSCHPPDLEGCLMRGLPQCIPHIQLVGMCISPKSIWSPSACVSPNPAGQLVCVHQIHLILKSVFSHIGVQCVLLYDAKWETCINAVPFLSDSTLPFHFCAQSTVHCGTVESCFFLLTKNFGQTDGAVGGGRIPS